MTRAVSIAAPAHAALLGDSAAGQRLHGENCSGCHDDSVYTRKDHKVRSLEELKTRLQGCSHAAKKDFSVAETQNLLMFMNDRYYHFK